MRKVNSRGRFLSKALACLMSVVLVVGLSASGVLVAYADEAVGDGAFAIEALSIESIAIQSTGDVFVGSTDVSAGGDFTVDGVACSYDASTRTLTLSGSGTITSYYASGESFATYSSIFTNVDLNIVVTGQVTLEAPYTGIGALNGIYSTEGHNIAISGSGMLKSIGLSYGIRSGADFTLDGATVYALASSLSHTRGVFAEGTVTINSGALYAGLSRMLSGSGVSAVEAKGITLNSSNGVIIETPDGGKVESGKVAEDHVNICNSEGTVAASAAIGVPCNYALFYVDYQECGHLDFEYGVPVSLLGIVGDFEFYTGFDTAKYKYSYTGESLAPWYASRDNITNVTFGSSCKGHLQPTSTAYWFFGLTKLTSIEGIDNLDTSLVTDMSGMFDNCCALSTLDVSSFDTAQVRDMSAMFDRCGVTSLDLTSFNTSNVTDMSWMFTNEGSASKLETLTLGESFTTANVTDMKSMFFGCDKLTSLDVSKFDTTKVTDMMQMFDYCKALTMLDVSSFNTAKVKDMGSMFCGCANLATLTLGSSFTSDSLTRMSQMFSGCRALTSLTFPEGFTATSVMSFSNAFTNCESLTELDLSKLTTKATGFGAAFSGCSNLTELKVSSLNTAQATSFQSMFSGCSKLTSLDLTNFDTRSAKMMQNMFSGCDALSSVTFGQNFSFKGNNIVPSSYTWPDGTTIVLSDWALLPTPDGLGDGDYTGNWWKGGAGTHYSATDMQGLTGSDIAGTWSWAQGYLANIASSEGGSAKAHPTSGSTGATTTLSAEPKEGYKFSHWQITSADGSGELSNAAANPATFTFGAANGEVRAVFAKNAYAIGALSKTSFTYSGARQAPSVTVRDSASGAVLRAGVHYTVSYARGSAAVASPVDAGAYTVYVTGKGDYSGMARASAGTFAIAKAPVAASAKAKTVKLKAKQLKKKKKAVSNLVVAAGQGKVTYKNVSKKKAAKKFKVSSKGKLTVPKGTKKGGYAVKVKVTTKGGANYKPGSKTVSFTVKVK